MLKNTLRGLLHFVYLRIFCLLPVRKRTVIFMSALGRYYTGSPKAIYEYMIDRGLDRAYQMYFVLDNPDSVRLRGGKAIRNARVGFYMRMATVKYLITDTRMAPWIFKRRGSVWIQLWHGTPLKKLGLDMEHVDMAASKDIDAYKREFIAESAKWDYLAAQNDFAAQVFRHAFGYGGKMLDIGYPRNDALVAFAQAMESTEGSDARDRAEQTVANIREILGIPVGKQVMLYAPTWRDDAYHDKSHYDFVTALDFDAMRAAFGDEYILVVKYHYLVKQDIDWSAYGGFVKQLDASCDITQVYLIADLLITDYSSVMFDYSILHRPMFFYCFDMADYKDRLRGFYFDINEQVPGPIVEDTPGLIAAIGEMIDDGQAFREKYVDSYMQFCETYHTYESGTACEKVVKVVSG